MVDIQECPGADIAIAELIVATLKALVSGRWVSNYLQRAWHHNDLLTIFKAVIKDAGATPITSKEFLLMFGLDRPSATAGELWSHLFAEVGSDLSADSRKAITHILQQGCLAQRILKRTGTHPEAALITEVYKELASCLREDRQLE